MEGITQKGSFEFMKKQKNKKKNRTFKLAKWNLKIKMKKITNKIKSRFLVPANSRSFSKVIADSSAYEKVSFLNHNISTTTDKIEFQWFQLRGKIIKK